MQYKHILFDLDGTLADSQEGIIHATLYALQEFGIKETDHSKLVSFIGPPLGESFKVHYQVRDEDLPFLFDKFNAYYDEQGFREAVLYDGVLELLENLQRHDLRLYIATGKSYSHAEAMMRTLGIHDYFIDIAGSDHRTDEVEIEKVHTIGYMLDKHSLYPQETKMIGDTRFDILGGKFHRLDTHAVTYGYGDAVELLSLDPDFVSHCPEEILQVF